CRRPFPAAALGARGTGAGHGRVRRRARFVQLRLAFVGGARRVRGLRGDGGGMERRLPRRGRAALAGGPRRFPHRRDAVLTVCGRTDRATALRRDRVLLGELRGGVCRYGGPAVARSPSDRPRAAPVNASSREAVLLLHGAWMNPVVMGYLAHV